jgi:hypothetical protein
MPDRIGSNLINSAQAQEHANAKTAGEATYSEPYPSQCAEPRCRKLVSFSIHRNGCMQSVVHASWIAAAAVAARYLC